MSLGLVAYDQAKANRDAYVRDTIKQNRVAVLEYKKGRKDSLRRLFIIPSTLYSESANELTFAFEGGGVYVWDGKKPLDTFDLVRGNFPLYCASDLAELVLNLFQIGQEKEGVQDAKKTGQMPTTIENET